MARRTTTPPPPESPTHSVEQLRRRIRQIQDCINALEAFDPEQVQKRYGVPEVDQLEASIDAALTAAFGHRTSAYNRYHAAANLDHGPHVMRTDPMFGGPSEAQYEARDAMQARQYFAEGKAKSMGLLKEAIKTLEYEIEDREPTSSAAASQAVAQSVDANKVFVVHGHDAAAKHEVARFLEHIDLDAIILSEQPDQGQTIIEKFERSAAEVGFAVVLLTPDDLGGSAVAASQTTRARQNVIFELGYFAGKLGRGRTCLLRKGDVEIPSDLYGVIYKTLDTGGGWRLELAKELKAAGLQFDANKVFG